MERVGVLGLGLMGSGFASNLISRGHEVHVYNRTRSKAEPLLARGAVFHSSPEGLAGCADVLITSLTDGRAVEEVAFGAGGFVKAMKDGSLWVDTSTIDPGSSTRHAVEAERLGKERLDAPVVGGPAAAAQGKVVLLVGGEEGTYRKHEGFLAELGNRAVYLGPAGSGHKMKLAVNLYLGLAAISFMEAFVFAQKMGFEPLAFVDAINVTQHRSPFSESKGTKLAEGDFTPTFTLDNLLKDLTLAQDEARRTGSTLPVFTRAIEFARDSKAGVGGRDYSVLAAKLQQLNGLPSGGVQ